jgi:hypothetical protein
MPTSAAADGKENGSTDDDDDDDDDDEEDVDDNSSDDGSRSTDSGSFSGSSSATSDSEDEHVAADTLLAGAETRRSGKCHRRGRVGVGCLFELVVEQCEVATRALVVITAGHCNHDVSDDDSRLWLPLPPSVLLAGQSGLGSCSAARGGVSFTTILHHMCHLNKAIPGVSRVLLLGKQALLPGLRGPETFVQSPPRKVGAKSIYSVNVVNGGLAAMASDSYSSSLASGAATAAAELAYCTSCNLALGSAAVIRCLCDPSRGAAHVDCIRDQVSIPETACLFCASHASGALGVSASQEEEALVLTKTGCTSVVDDATKGSDAPSLSLTLKIGLGRGYAGFRCRLRRRQVHNIRSSMRRVERSHALVGEDLLVSLRRLHSSNNFYTHLFVGSQVSFR